MKSPSPFATTLNTNTDTDVVTVSVVGEFEAATVPAFEVATGKIIDLEPAEVVLDLALVTLIDSAAIGAIMRFRQSLSNLTTHLRISAPHPYQVELFAITGLPHILDNR